MFNGMKFFIPFRYAVFKDKNKKELVLVQHISIILIKLALDIELNFKRLI